MTEEAVFLGLSNEQLKLAAATGLAMAVIGFATGLASVVITQYFKEKI